jgi:hypothetical protein
VRVRVRVRFESGLGLMVRVEVRLGFDGCGLRVVGAVKHVRN